MKPPGAKTSGIFAGDSLGSAFVGTAAEGVLEFRYVGYVSRAIGTRALEQATTAMLERPGAHVLLFDTLEHTGHDHGNMAVAIRWIIEHRARIDRVALIARSQAMLSLANVGRVMIPGLDVCVFANRAEALAWCVQAKPRVTTGRRSSAA